MLRGFAARRAMFHIVHMKTIAIRELHLATGRWVRHAATTREPVIVTDRGRRVALLQAFVPDAMGRPLPEREQRIHKRPRTRVDSATYQAEMRGRA